MRLPTTNVTPFIAFQALVTIVCSLRRHHIVVTATQDGAIMASNTPRQNRRPSSEEKSVHAVITACDAPQRNTAPAMTLPYGSLTRTKAARGWKTSWAKYKMEPSQEYWRSWSLASSIMPKMET